MVTGRTLRAFALGVALTTVATVLGVGAAPATVAMPASPDGLGREAVDATALPLAGIVVVVDPGHQLGNSTHPRQISRLVSARGFRKQCNTTGTATTGGFPEATFTFRVASRVRARLVHLGARVVMTRYRNSLDLWGPCVDYRGKLGNAGFRHRVRTADLKLSIHADGSAKSHRGFHLIVARKPGGRAASTAYAKALRASLQDAGYRRSTYIGRGTALDYRGDLATLNWSRMPAVMVELGNMRNARDARPMRTASGQARYARALVRGIRAYLTG